MLEDTKPVSQEPRSRPANAKFARRQRSVDDTWRVGVFLRVRGNGEKIWLQHIWVDGQPRKVVLGNFPNLSMAEARKAAAENQNLVDSGGDLVAKQRQENNNAIRARLDNLTERVNSAKSAVPDPASASSRASTPVKHEPKTQKNRSNVQAPEVVAPGRLRTPKKPTAPTTHNEADGPTVTTQNTSSAPEPNPTPQKLQMSEVISDSTSRLSSPATRNIAAESIAQQLRDEARGVGPNVLALIEHILNEAPKSVIALRRCEGILALKQSGDNHLDDVCAQALDAGDISLTGVMSRVQAKRSKDLDEADSGTSDMAHANIRGANYFY